MSGDTDEGEKEFEATQHKLDEARRKGELVKSTEITVAASYAGLLIAAYGLGAPLLESFGARAMAFLEKADSLSLQARSSGASVVGGILEQMIPPLIPFFLIPVALVILALVAQKAVVFAPEKLQMRLNRVSPLSNAKQKFGRSGLFEFAKSFVKLLLISLILGMFLLRQIDRILASQRIDAIFAISDLLRMIIEFIFIVMILSVVIGGIDYLWQRAEFLRKHRMSRKELQDEMKSSEGDPHMKQRRRQRGIELAMGQMLADVPKADVVIVNPTHYAVALKWERASGRAPICVAKGVDEIAARIREVARDNNVPVHSDPPTARALYATIEIGQEIKPDHYKPVAAAIRFAEKMRTRAKARRGA